MSCDVSPVAMFSSASLFFGFCICSLEQIKVLSVRYIGHSTRYSQYSSCPNTLGAIFIFVHGNILFLTNNIPIFILNTSILVTPYSSFYIETMHVSSEIHQLCFLLTFTCLPTTISMQLKAILATNKLANKQGKN